MDLADDVAATLLAAGILLTPRGAVEPAHDGSTWIASRVAALGFEVSDVVAGSLQAWGDVPLFCEVFPTAAGALVERAAGVRHDELALPVDELSAAVGADLHGWVQAVFVQADPDFGPTDVVPGGFGP